MTKGILYVLAALTLLMPSCDKSARKTVSGFEAIIPRPAMIQQEKGEFVLDPSAQVVANDSMLNFERQWLYGFLGLSQENKGAARIELSIEDLADSLGDEGYVMHIHEKGIRIAARSSAGIFYGIQSLRQMLPPEIETGGLKQPVTLPLGKITDKPRFPWRGLLLDCCRHFMDKDFVLRYIDLLAMQKMNRLHWHLTEDQGWRIEIKKYPLLTEVGAWRTQPDGKRYGGYYTQDDIREVVAYAAERHVMVVPEIEMPGHSVAALAAYPELSCTGGPFEVESNWGVFKDIYCAGNDKVFEFLEGVLDEVMELFPSPYIHLGGDEAPRYRWENCPRCQKRMKDENLKEEAQLQTYFMTRVSDYLSANGRKVIGWDEILEGGLMPGATVQSWRGMEGALEAVNHGHDAIVSPTSHAYFDYPVRSIDVEKVYSFDPVPENIPSDQYHRILGGECNMWSERAPQHLVDQKLYPRILAMAEVLWTPVKGKDFKSFMDRLQAFYPRLDALKVDYGPETEAVRIRNILSGKNRVIAEIIPGQRGTELHYLLADAAGKTLVEGRSSERLKLAIGRDALLKVDARLNTGASVEYLERSYSIHKALAIKPKYRQVYHQNYTAAGDVALTDGVQGSLHFRDGNWQGFEGIDMDVTIDLGRTDTLSYVGAGFLQSAPSWIFMPMSVEMQLLTEHGKVILTFFNSTETAQTNNNDVKELIEFTLDGIPARFVRVKASNVGVCPPWHPGAGGKSWIFADEIIVK